MSLFILSLDNVLYNLSHYAAIGLVTDDSDIFPLTSLVLYFDQEMLTSVPLVTLGDAEQVESVLHEVIRQITSGNYRVIRLDKIAPTPPDTDTPDIPTLTR